MTRLAYSINETCELLGGISRSHLYKLIGEGQIHVSKVGHRSLVTHDQIVRLLDVTGAHDPLEPLGHEPATTTLRVVQ